MTHRSPKKDYQLNRNDLAGEYKYGDAGQLLLSFMFALTWIGDTFILKYTTFLNQDVPNAIRLPLGIIFLSISTFLAIKGLSIVFGEKRENPAVIRKSVFRVVRHPIYLSEILLYLGLLMLSISLTAALIWALTISFLHYIAKYEERLCLVRYGEEYNIYMQDVPMWIPGLWKRKR